VNQEIMNSLFSKEAVGMLNFPKAFEEQGKVVVVVQFFGWEL